MNSLRQEWRRFSFFLWKTFAKRFPEFLHFLINLDEILKFSLKIH